MSVSPTPASRGGAVGNCQWMKSEMAVAIKKALRKLRKPSRDRKYSHVKKMPVNTKCPTK